MMGAHKGEGAALDGRGLRIGIVQARFNQGITDALAAACRAELASLGVADGDVVLEQVPGALEVPLALQALAATERFDALIALGCVIRGETYHFELVCNESAAGITRVALDHHIPIANAILTVENLSQAVARQEEKARDAARVAVEMAHLLRRHPLD
ncbi:6,7-dimethyl-8-ribityllumazine synthase [Tepidimonas alkaliphilus]|uniref:6,7-dimethyl-8-ribityllumazine synthase n=1 Tax=Tepidimonas alkaliphilus TaxID=2588942 RepID=A0A554W4P5_9BURK|nr:6,7-dimethyl-8-ribityllumazine synthase [Tepidimonas alkaliphilus]TSE18545.1 6,7-dimethyl-8-ribityllumazine synthase [Tepidimonas alkaliphilus]